MSSPSAPLAAPIVLEAAAPPGAPQGGFRVGLCLREAWSGTWPSLLPWFGIFAATTAVFSGVLLALSPPIADAAIRQDAPALEAALLRAFGWYAFACLALGPALGWGSVRFALHALERRARFSDLLEGFRIGRAWPRFAALTLALFSVGMPLYALTLRAQTPEVGLLCALGTLVWFYGVCPRLVLAVFFVVDAGEGPLQALASSWRATRGRALASLGLMLCAASALLLGTLALGIGIVPANLLVMLLWASAYRQVRQAPGQVRPAQGPAHPVKVHQRQNQRLW